MMTKYYIAMMPTFEVAGKTAGGEMIRDNDGSLIIMESVEGDDSRRALIVPRFVRLKRGAPYNAADPAQVEFTRRVTDMLNATKRG